MSLLQWNIRSFSANQEQVRILFQENNVSAICLQETKLGELTPNIGHNFLFYRSAPFIGERAQGGTGIIVHRSVNHRALQINSELQACAVQIYTNRWITLCSLYLEPELESRLQDIHGLPRHLELNDLQNLLDQLPHPYILMGDFNAKHTLW